MMDSDSPALTLDVPATAEYPIDTVVSEAAVDAAHADEVLFGGHASKYIEILADIANSAPLYVSTDGGVMFWRLEAGESRSPVLRRDRLHVYSVAQGAFRIWAGY